MNDLILGACIPLLALVALLAIAWARRQDNQVRRKARHLQWRIEADLEGFQIKCHRVRQRAVMIADVYARGNQAKKRELTQGTDELVAQMDRVNAEFERISARLARARRKDLWIFYMDLLVLVRDLQGLTRDLDDLDKLWARELADMSALRTARISGAGEPGATPV